MQTMEMIFHEEKISHDFLLRCEKAYFPRVAISAYNTFQSKKMEKEEKREPSDECQNKISLIKNCDAKKGASLGDVKRASTFDFQGVKSQEVFAC